MRRAHALLTAPAIFVAALWVSLATALLSAMLPVGLPLTQSTGSAFNPATTAVALRATAVQPRTAIQWIDDDDGPATDLAPTLDATALPPPAAPSLPAPRGDAAPAPRFASPSDLPTATLGLAYPRGPPAPAFARGETAAIHR
jgi:hypothetical protein